MTLRGEGSRAREAFAKIRAATPEVGAAEEDLGLRLTIARNVLRLRVQRGYTQAQLAERMSVRQPRIAQIEAGAADLRVSTLARLAEVLGVEVTRFFEEERKPAARGAPRAPRRSTPLPRRSGTR
jgi:ribosome-binding protein aMBF1 (putative translation factor)